MTRTNGGKRVEAGFYWRAAEWEIVTLSGRGGVLPGGDEDVYHRIPTLAMLMAAPVMGALFVMFLPFIGFALLLQHLGRLALRGSRRAALAVGATLVPAWRPGEAYFAHDNEVDAGDGRSEGTPRKAADAPDALDEIEKTIEERRG